MSLGQITSREQEFRREIIELIQKWELHGDSEKYVNLLKNALSATLVNTFYDGGIVTALPNKYWPLVDAKFDQWEYIGISPQRFITGELNEMGKQGWELVFYRVDMNECNAIFKRKRKDNASWKRG